MSEQDGTVFLIDDDPGIRDSLSLLLALNGIRTQVFANAESFIDTFVADWYGCVLTDLRMPGMTGLELQTVLRKRKIELPVVVLTAHGDVATVRTALKNGAFDYLEKPVEDEMLLDVLRNALRADGYFSWDSGLSKAFKTWREQTFSLKAEVFNITNAVRFNGLTTNGASTKLGVYTSTLTRPRQMQFSGTYRF